MDKSLAMAWLVKNVTKWPTSRGGIKSSPDGWSWGESSNSDIQLFTDTPAAMYVDCCITQSEWLNGVGDIKPESMSRSDAFNWVYNKYGKCMSEWPVVGVDCRTLIQPCGWSWSIPSEINQKFKPGVCAELVGPPTVDCENITYEQLFKYCTDEKIDKDIQRYVNVKIKVSTPKPLPVYYIAGPMSGLPNFNRKAFHDAQHKLSMIGHVLNPATLPDGLSQRDYMSICLPMVQASTHMFMLKGWEKSPGANAEHSLAVKLKLEIEYE